MTKIKPLTLDKTWRFYSAHFILRDLTMQLMEPGSPVVPISAAKNEGIEGLIFVR